MKSLIWSCIKLKTYVENFPTLGTSSTLIRLHGQFNLLHDSIVMDIQYILSCHRVTRQAITLSVKCSQKPVLLLHNRDSHSDEGMYCPNIYYNGMKVRTTFPAYNFSRRRALDEPDSHYIKMIGSKPTVHEMHSGQ